MKKVIIVFTVLLLAVPILSADFEIYGKLGMAGWWMHSERFYDDSIAKEIDTIIIQNDTTLDTTNTIYGADTIPVKTNIMEPAGKLGFKFTGDRFGGCVEIGAFLNLYDSDLVGSGTGALSNYKKRSFFARIRKFYAEWYINDYITFLIGQTSAPGCFVTTSNQAFDGGTAMCNVGCLYTGRAPMLQFSFGNQLGADLDEFSGLMWEGKIAAIKVDTAAVEYKNKNPSLKVHYHSKTTMPKFEGSFGVNLENELLAFNGKIAGGYLQYRSVKFDEADSAQQLYVNAWVVGGDFGAKIGPVKLSYDIFGGQNLGTYGVWIGDRFGWWRIADYMRPFYPVDVEIKELNSDSVLVVVGEEVKNGLALEMAVVLNYKPFDFISFETGVGGIIGKHEYKYYEDKWAKIWPDHPMKFWQKIGMIAWYVQTEVEVFEQLTFTPEVGQYIYGPYLGFGKYVYWGLNTIISF